MSAGGTKFSGGTKPTLNVLNAETAPQHFNVFNIIKFGDIAGVRHT